MLPAHTSRVARPRASPSTPECTSLRSCTALRASSDRVRPLTTPRPPESAALHLHPSEGVRECSAPSSPEYTVAG
eukprot:15437907-Alexandrium_andersonii.AAC.1